MATEPIYQDFDLTFAIHPVRKDLVLNTDANSVIKSIVNLLMTNHFEVPMHPEIGCNIRKLLFENLAPYVAKDISRFIQETIRNFEPRARVSKLVVTPDVDLNGYNVHLECFIDTSPKLQSVDFLLQRTR